MRTLVCNLVITLYIEEEKKAEKAIEDGDYEAFLEVKIKNAKWEIL